MTVNPLKFLFAIAFPPLLMSGNSFVVKHKSTYSITVEVDNLRNSKGLVQFALYNREGVFPDEHYEKYYLKRSSKIHDASAKVTFTDVPEGIYAVNILHDENEDGKINKTLFLPKEGIGFSNYDKIGLGNKPNFKNASFIWNRDKAIKIKVIYF